MIAVLYELGSATLGSGRCDSCKDMTNVDDGSVCVRVEDEIAGEG